MRTVTKRIECSAGCGKTLSATVHATNRQAQKIAWSNLHYAIQQNKWRTSFPGAYQCDECNHWLNDPPVGKELL